MTRQYSGLESNYQRYRDRGLRILAFPADNLLGQERGSNEQIAEFCSTKFHVSFDLFAKVAVAGANQAPIYRFLTQYPDRKIRGRVLWNFQKYLVDRTGRVVAKYMPMTRPDSRKVVRAIEAALGGTAQGMPAVLTSGSGGLTGT